MIALSAPFPVTASYKIKLKKVKFMELWIILQKLAESC